MDQPLKRRQFMDLVGASLALAACSRAITACGPHNPPPTGAGGSGGSGTGGSSGGGGALDADAAPPDPPGQHVAMLLYPGMTLLDLIGPQTCFISLAMTVHLVWKTRDPITTDSNVTLVPTTSFAECPQNLEILFVPGSTRDTATMIRDAEVQGFLSSRGQRAKLVTSVCTGSLILGAAGLLRGYKATSHWLGRELLPLVGAERVDARYVEDRNRITGAGVTSGIDFGLRLVEKLRGRQLAEVTQLMLEYAPDPPFDAGTPETAPPEVIAIARSLFADPIDDARAALADAGGS